MGRALCHAGPGTLEGDIVRSDVHTCSGHALSLVRITRDGYRARSLSFSEGKGASLLGGEPTVDGSEEESTTRD